MKKEQVTIHDIARYLGLNSSTISRALNDSPRVTSKTKEKVKKAAAELGYKPNLMATNLRRRSSKTIGVIVPWISRHFFSLAISGIEQVAYAEGYNVMICQSHDDYEREVANAFTLYANRVEGIICSMAMDSDQFDHMQQFTDENIPIVFFDRYPEGIQACRVTINDFDAAYQVVSHLAETGRKRIAYFSGPKKLNIYRDRFNGYKKALEAYGIKFDEQLVYSCRLLQEDGADGMKYLLSLPNMPDALFSANDLAALSAMKYLKQHTALTIPKDMAVAGFSNSPGSSLIDPELTTVDQSAEEMGKAAAQRLIAEIKTAVQPGKPTSITVPSNLIIRHSSTLT